MKKHGISNERSSMKINHPCLLAVAVLLGLVQGADATLIQIGDASLGGDRTDGNGSRLNIELDGVNLGPNTYHVMQFGLDTAGTGAVTPLLFQRNNPNDGYTVLWVGSNINVSGTGISTTNYSYGAEMFSLTSPTEVFVGAWHDGGAKVRFINNSGATDHDGNRPGIPQNPTSFFVGQNLADTDITNSGIRRTYMMEANIAVPEPSTTFVLAAALGLTGWRRRRRRLSMG